MSDPNPVLELAKEMGYNPDFDGEGKKSPEEFIKHSNTIVRNQSGKIKDLMSTVENMSSEFSNVQKLFADSIDSQNTRHAAELKKEKAALEAKWEEAVIEADPKEAKKIQGEIKAIEETERTTTTKKADVDPNQEIFNKWREKNLWLDDDKKGQAEFKKAHIDLLTEHGNDKGAKFELDYIEKKLKEKMPEKFGLRAKEEPAGGDVGEGKSTDKVTKELKIGNLNSSEKELFAQQKKAFGKHFNEKSTLAAFAAVRASKGAK